MIEVKVYIHYMENKIINYGMILLIFYASWVIYNQENEIVEKRHLLNEVKETIIKQRNLIDAQAEYIYFLEKSTINNSPIYQGPPKLFREPI